MSNARIAGRVSLAPELVAQTSPGDTVFIYATPAQGGRMPLAIVRTTVVLKARISKTGQAMAQPGELGVSLGPIKNPSNQLSLVIRGPLP